MPDSFLVVALGLDPRVQGKRRSGRPGCSARGPSMTGKEAVRGDEESQLHLPAELAVAGGEGDGVARSEEHTSELQSLMHISSDVFCLNIKNAQRCIYTVM